MAPSPPKHEEQRRYATVLFADVSGFTALSERMDPEDVTALMNECFTLLEGAVLRHGGMVDKYIGDCVMALFGVPVALEEAPRNAINAAIEMRTAIYGFRRDHPELTPLDIHSGINTGLVLAGDVGGDHKRDFTVMGDTVNLAARLKDASPKGSIWVGPETFRLTRDAFEFRTLKPITFKGKDHPVRTFEVRSEHQVIHRLRAISRRSVGSRLVGRDAELERLRDTMVALVAGRGGAVSLIGDAGLGKTRLTTELMALPVAHEVTFLQARSLSVGQTLSYHPFVDLLRSWAAIDEEAPAAEWMPQLRAAVAEHCGDQTADIFPFIATLMGAPLAGADQERVAGIQGAAMESLIVKSVRELFERLAAARPLALVFEDLHWADQSSIALLTALLPLAREHRLVFVGVYRPDFPDTAARFLESARRLLGPAHVEIALHPLDARHSRTLIDDLFRHGDLPTHVRGMILEKTAGNPFYVEEVIRALLDEGAATLSDGALRATEKILTVTIPSTIREVILVRVDRLPPRPRQVFQVASVIGRSFDRTLLAEVVAEPAHLNDDLELLADLELLVSTDVFTFKHAIIQEVAYDSILRTTRQHLHGRVAQVIETRHGQVQAAGYESIAAGDRGRIHGQVAVAMEAQRRGAGGVNGMLAYHFGLAGQPERAEPYLLEAGDEAARSAASNEALHFFRQASELTLRLYGETGDRKKLALLERNLALALFNRGQLIEAGRHFNRALEYLGEFVPHTTLGLGMRFATTLTGVLWRAYVPRRLRPLRPATDADREVIAVMYARAQAQTTADPGRFLFDTMETPRRLDTVDPRTVPNAGGIYASLVGIFSYTGLSFRIGARFLARAAPLVDPTDVREQMTFQLMRYLHHLLQGDWRDDYAIDDDLIAQNLRRGLLWPVTNYLGLNTHQRIHRGDFAGARAQLSRIASIEDTYGHDLAKSYRQATTAHLLTEERDLPRALDASEAYYAGHQDKLINLYALAALAKVQTLMGRLAHAKDTLANATELVRGAGTVPPFHLASYLRSCLLYEVTALEAGGTPASRDATRIVRRALRQAGLAAWHRPEVYRLAGTLAWLRQRPKAAVAWWERSVAAGERLGARPDLARTQVEIARRLGSGGDPARRIAGRNAREALDAARTIFSDLGLVHDLQHVAALERGAA